MRKNFPILKIKKLRLKKAELTCPRSHSWVVDRQDLEAGYLLHRMNLFSWSYVTVYKKQGSFLPLSLASSILSLFLLLFCLLRGPHWGPLLGLCLSTLNSLCKICSLICILFSFTCWQVLVLKSPALSLVLCDTVTDLFICLISDQRNGTGSPESDPDVSGHQTDDRGGSAEQ